MKKITFVSILSFIFLSLSGTFTYLFSYLPFKIPWVFMITGIFILIASGIFSAVYGKAIKANIIIFVVNAVSLGLCIKAWYIFRGFSNSLLIMLLVSLIVTAVLWLFYLLLFIPFLEKHFGIYIWLFIISVIVIYVFVMAFTKTHFVSTIGFYMIVEIAFFCIVYRNQSFQRSFQRNCFVYIQYSDCCNYNCTSDAGSG